MPTTTTTNHPTMHRNRGNPISHHRVGIRGRRSHANRPIVQGLDQAVPHHFYIELLNCSLNPWEHSDAELVSRPRGYLPPLQSPGVIPTGSETVPIFLSYSHNQFDYTCSPPLCSKSEFALLPSKIELHTQKSRCAVCNIRSINILVL